MKENVFFLSDEIDFPYSFHVFDEFILSIYLNRIACFFCFILVKIVIISFLNSLDSVP